jgi:hypothetical protein
MYLMTQALSHFKIANKIMSFNMVHCWTAVRDCPMWHELFVSHDADAKPEKSNAIYVDSSAPSEASASMRLRGHTSSMAEAKRDASSQVTMETIKTLLGTRRCQVRRRTRESAGKKRSP